MSMVAYIGVYFKCMIVFVFEKYYLKNLKFFLFF
jgi:hypothetical protein